MDCKTPDGKSYCYARKIYRRFDIMGINTIESQQDKIILDDKELRVFSHGFKRSDTGPRKASKIFVCSTIEIFHPSIPCLWRDRIFEIIGKEKRHTFIILTKLPRNIDRPMPENVWLGVTMTGENFYHDSINTKILGKIQANLKFVSFEPIFDYPPIIHEKWLKWIILGRLTGFGRKHDPRKEVIERIINLYKKMHIPIFMKNNLRPIMGDDLIQEWPKEA